MSGPKATLGLQSLAAAFDGLICSDEAEIRKAFGQDMYQSPAGDSHLLTKDQIEEIQALPADVRQTIRQLMFIGYVGGWTRREIEILEFKARART